MRALLVVLAASALSSVLVTPLVLHGARARALYGRGNEARHIHGRPVPRLGGVAIFVSTALGLLVATMLSWRLSAAALAPANRQLAATVVLGGMIVFATGVADDLRGLRPWTKLLIELAVATAISLGSVRIGILTLGSGAQLTLGWLAFPITILWVVGVTNAFNLIDGLDGLAAGIAVVALGTVLTTALVAGNMEVAVVCGALLGALLGFLPYNFNPARIFLGDSGSLFVGYLLAVISLFGSFKSTTALLAIVPLFALAVPLLDATVTVVRRWLRGAPIFAPDGRHIHHRLLAIGLTQRRAAAMLCLMAVAVALLGLVLAFAPPTAVVGIALAGGAASLLLLAYGARHLNYHEFLEAGVAVASGFSRVRRVMRDRIRAREIAEAIPQVETLGRLNAMLGASTAEFGFLGMEVDRESSAGYRRVVMLRGQAARAWKLDFPVAARRSADDDPYVLRIWCAPEHGRPFGAERVALILAPAVERWLAAATSAPLGPADVEVRLAPLTDGPMAAGSTYAVGLLDDAPSRASASPSEQPN